MNVGILFGDFGPYHAARIEALAAALDRQGINLIALRFSARSDIYGWKPVEPQGVEVITLADRHPESAGQSWRAARSFYRFLKDHKITTILLPSFSPLPYLLCLIGARLAGCKAVLMTESWRGTEKSGPLGRAAKHLVIRLFSSALVGGTRQREYVCAYGQKPANVFLGYDVVDGDYYEREARRWKSAATDALPVTGLPGRFFLNIGRFVPKKNLSVLIGAYARFVEKYPATSIALVLVGEGTEETKLKQMVLEHGLNLRIGPDENRELDSRSEVVFYPFQQYDLTPIFFARCEAFILPSLYEEWGLVVNEAMASGAPVLVSVKVGCGPDLVIEGKNGFVFDPNNSKQLASLLEKFAADPALSTRMGGMSSEHIRDWGPERFADGGVQALRIAAKIAGTENIHNIES